ncbi:hypothetical protein P0L94_00765 [Microbacter sp. GSS18]|nr:hypothetical protein P0L94_00765 [Microbacter sp. GSS18]
MNLAANDVLVVATANPEDYTNRGRIITPLQDRFGAEIRTHYPQTIEEEIAVIRQEADLVADVPSHLLEVLARFTRNLRESDAVDQRAGVSARFAIAGAETIAAAALHRATRQHEDVAVARPVDLETAVEVLGGKIEFETGEEGRERAILEHLLRVAVAETARAHLRGLDTRVLADALHDGATVMTGEQVTAADVLAAMPVLGESDLYDEVADRLEASTTGETASWSARASPSWCSAARSSRPRASGGRKAPPRRCSSSRCSPATSTTGARAGRRRCCAPSGRASSGCSCSRCSSRGRCGAPGPGTAARLVAAAGGAERGDGRDADEPEDRARSFWNRSSVSTSRSGTRGDSLEYGGRDPQGVRALQRLIEPWIAPGGKSGGARPDVGPGPAAVGVQALQLRLWRLSLCAPSAVTNHELSHDRDHEGREQREHDAREEESGVAEGRRLTR